MFMFFMSFVFMLPMFVLSCMFAFEFAGLVAGLGDAVTVAFELALLFEFSAVVHAVPKTARANNARIPIVRLISLPPGCNIPQMQGAGNFGPVGPLLDSL
jgi:hypothetical protein